MSKIKHRHGHYNGKQNNGKQNNGKQDTRQ